MATFKTLYHSACKLALLLFFGLQLSPALHAQMPTTAAAYPFVSTTGTYTYLTGGTQLTAYLPAGYSSFNADDVWAPNVPLGFTFPYCGNNYTTVTPCSNGWIALGTQGGSYLTNTNSQASAPIFPVVFPLWDDLDGASGGSSSFLTTGTAPNRVFTMEWRDWEWNYQVNAPVISFQVKLYENGLIEFWYKSEANAPGTASASIGIGGGTVVGGTYTDFQSLPNTSASPVPSTTVFNTTISTKPATDQIYRWGQLPCTGVPTTSITGPYQVCPNKSFTIGLSGLSLFSGLTYQWQESANGSVWTDISGATNSTLTDVISAPKWYRCKVTCANSTLTYITPGYLMAIAPFYYCYCNNTATAIPGIDVGNVVMTKLPLNDTLLNNGIGIPVENNVASNKSYTDFRYVVPPVPMYHDSNYKFVVSQINSGTFTAAMTSVFIDYNRNGTFDDTERVLLAPTVNVLPNPGIVSSTFKLPDSAQYGLTGMRVTTVGGNTAPDTCGNYANGETEDYLIDLRYVPCNGQPNIGHIEGDTSMCTGYNYVLRDTSYEKYRHGIERYWQVSADAVNWVDIAGSKNKDTLARIFSGQPLFYRVMGVCTHSNDTGYSNPHKVNIKPGYKCYCHSQSMGGAKDTSDIGGFTIANFSVTDGGTHLLNPRAFNQREDYTDLDPIKLDVDSIYKFTVFHTMPFENHSDAKITVFIDFNNNKQYDVPSELIFTGFTSIGYHVLLNNLIIPNTVIVDVPTGLRIIANNDVSPNKPSDEGCGEYVSGETEDYIVMFKRSFKAGINDVHGMQQLSLSPNPTNGKFQVQFKGAATTDGIAIRILNMTGQLVKQAIYPYAGGVFRQEIDLGNEAKGIYMVEVTANGQRTMQKLTVQ